MAQSPVNPPIKVWILTGFLGAGKTSLMNHWLQQPLFAENPLALIINEFGQLGVDAKQLPPGHHQTVEINKGSVFCICTRTDLIKALGTMIDSWHPAHLIIEATGIAQPADLEALLAEPQWNDRFEIQPTTCLVDAEHFIQVAAFSQPCVAQVRWADRVVINKTDLVSPQELDSLNEVLQGLNRQAEILETSHGQVEPLTGQLHVSRPCQQVDQPPDDIVSVSLSTEQPVDKTRFDRLLNDLDSHILRLKGNIAFQGAPQFVDVVVKRITTKPICPALGATHSRFVVIGWKISREELQSAFETCFIS